jgi:predicted dehydrogenase/acetyltransferase-like isoleucine patch superfamily enzyme
MINPSRSSSGAPRVAVVGCGHWGRNLVRNFHMLGALAGVCDASSVAADEQSKLYGVPALSLEDILANPEIDALVVATPAVRHARVALAAIEAGKHVFVEKPLALELADAYRVMEQAAARGRIVMVGHLLRYHPAFIELNDLVAQGRLGRLQYVIANRLNLGRFRREEDVFWSFAPHDISMILALAGESPEHVTAVGHCYLHSRIADVTTTHLRFPTGANAHLFVSWLHPCKEQKLVVVGDGGMAIFDDSAPWGEKLVVYPHRVTWTNGLPEPTRAEGKPVLVHAAEPLRLECEHFLDCLRDGRRPRTDVREGIGVLRVLDAARRSMQLGEGVDLASRPPERYFVHPTASVEPGSEIGTGTRIWNFSQVFPGARIGRDCTIGQNVSIGPGVVVGDHCKIQNNVSVYAGVTLEDGVFCGPACVFTNVSNPRAEIERKNEFRRTLVGRGATIGANATIVCGHRLGAYCFVGAGAVVTRDVPAHALVVGNPARQIGWMSRAGHRLDADLVCPQTGERYALDARGALVCVADREVA